MVIRNLTRNVITLNDIKKVFRPYALMELQDAFAYTSNDLRAAVKKGYLEVVSFDTSDLESQEIASQAPVGTGGLGTANVLQDTGFNNISSMPANVNDPIPTGVWINLFNGINISKDGTSLRFGKN